MKKYHIHIKPAVIFILHFIFLQPSAKSQFPIDTTYQFKARLTETAPRTPFCGNTAWAVVQKFEVVSTNLPGYKNKYVVVIQPCPEFLEKNFFKSNAVYDITVADSSAEKNHYSFTNSYEREHIPIFWSRGISKSK